MHNYHIHTYRCKHATGDVEDYVKKAVDKNMETIGFTEHTPLPDDYLINIRMSWDDFLSYIESIDNAKLKFSSLNIYKGLECEYDKIYHNFYLEIFEQYNLDYLICGAHFFRCDGDLVFAYSRDFMTKKELRSYTDSIIQAIESGLFAFIAHPDLFGCFYMDWDDEAIACSKAIIEAAESNNTLLEINTQGWSKGKVYTSNGLRHSLRHIYPLDEFWELASDYDINAIVNSDAHSPERVDEGLVRGYKYAEKFNIKTKFLEGHLIKK